jgi:protein TonB
MQGLVILESIIDENGSVAHVKILKGLPFGLDRAAVVAVRQWRWQPATKAGTAVAIRYIVMVNFDSSVVKSKDRISARSGP